MMMLPPTTLGFRVGLAVVCLLAPAVAVADGDDGRGATATAAAGTAQPRARRPDFLFGRPGHSLSIRGQWNRARAESDLFAFVGEELTLERGDFNAPGLAIDVGFAVGSRLDIRTGLDFTRAFARSESRDFTDANGVPIEQDTTLRQADLFGSIAIALIPRGRSIGQYSWIPNPVVPYLGGGGGFLWYQFEQIGEFVDFVDLSIFEARFESSGWTASAHLLGGVDIRLTPRLFLSTEARYVWADAGLTRDFSNFDPIDLTGLRIAAGVRFVF